jgi:hypothetical protein
MKTLTLLQLVAGLALAFSLSPNPLHGAAGDLKIPGVSYPGSYDDAGRKAVSAALTLEDCEFLGGRWVNSMTSLRYAGDTAALSKFLQALAKCPDATISLSFANELFEGGDWLVQHHAHGHHFHVRINVGSVRISLPRLDLPVIATPANPAEADDNTSVAADRYTPSAFFLGQ